MFNFKTRWLRSNIGTDEPSEFITKLAYECVSNNNKLGHIQNFGLY